MTQRRIYQDEYPYFVTFRVAESQPLFEDEKMAEQLSEIILNAGRLKRYEILAYQIMPEHVHVLVNNISERTLENVRSVGDMKDLILTESTLSRVRIDKNRMRSVDSFNISDLLQSIKGNFSRKIHEGNIWQKRFYTKIVNTHKYLETVIQYIENNPIKAELPKKYQQKPYQYFNWPKIHALF
jgi:REP element-mobilizing transposase RayT